MGKARGIELEARKKEDLLGRLLALRPTPEEENEDWRNESVVPEM
jgi:hypothetical protein